MASTRPDAAAPDPDRASRELVVPLEEAGDRPVAHVGGKARTLGRLLREGFPVPDGVVLPAPAALCVSGREGEDRDAGESDPPAEADGRLQGVVQRLGPGPFAVRSSAASEDSDASSYAGQFRTELGVSGTGEL